MKLLQSSVLHVFGPMYMGVFYCVLHGTVVCTAMWTSVEHGWKCEIADRRNSGDIFCTHMSSVQRAVLMQDRFSPHYISISVVLRVARIGICSPVYKTAGVADVPMPRESLSSDRLVDWGRAFPHFKRPREFATSWTPVVGVGRRCGWNVGL